MKIEIKNDKIIYDGKVYVPETKKESELVTGEGIEFGGISLRGLIFGISGSPKRELYLVDGMYCVDHACDTRMVNLPLQPIKFGEWEVGDWVYSTDFIGTKFDSVEHYLLIVDNRVAIRLWRTSQESIEMLVPILIPLAGKYDKNYWKVIF